MARFFISIVSMVTDWKTDRIGCNPILSIFHKHNAYSREKKKWAIL